MSLIMFFYNIYFIILCVILIVTIIQLNNFISDVVFIYWNVILICYLINIYFSASPKTHNKIFIFSCKKNQTGDNWRSFINHQLRINSAVKDKQRSGLITNFVIQFWHIEFGFLSIKQMILRLFDDWRHAIKLSTICIGFHNFHGRPSWCAPIHHPTFAYNIIHRANDFWNVRLRKYVRYKEHRRDFLIVTKLSSTW